MKKIMFNDRYGLTQAVIELRKTMTRMVFKEFRTGEIICAKDVESIGMYSDENLVEFSMKDGSIKVSVPKYKVGDVVAVAQSYKSIHEEMMNGDYSNSRYDAFRCAMAAGTKGWNNKMYVRADLMPHQIRITDIKVERLHDISVKDCYEEGIVYAKWRQWLKPDSREYIDHDVYTLGIYKEGILDPWAPDDPDAWIAKDPQTAFHVLIRKMMGVKKWENNPYVFAYSFKLIK